MLATVGMNYQQKRNVMKISKWWFMFVAGLLAVALVSCATSHQNSQVTMTGLMVCGKCKLHITKECQNVLQVQENGQTVNYFLVMNKVSTDFHPQICDSDGMETTVTGTVTEQDGKEVMTPTKITPVADSNSK